jgi:hypothetical protein
MAKPLEGAGRYFVGFRCRASRRASAIWRGRTHDRDRGVRIRLRAEVAADTD